jgi:hypothetical protein
MGVRKEERQRRGNGGLSGMKQREYRKYRDSVRAEIVCTERECVCG